MVVNIVMLSEIQWTNIIYYFAVSEHTSPKNPRKVLPRRLFNSFLNIYFPVLHNNYKVMVLKKRNTFTLQIF